MDAFAPSALRSKWRCRAQTSASRQQCSRTCLGSIVILLKEARRSVLGCKTMTAAKGRAAAGTQGLRVQAIE
jgi:hypothetical protein